MCKLGSYVLVMVLLLGLSNAGEVPRDGDRLGNYSVEDIYSRIAEANKRRDQELRTFLDQRTYTIMHGNTVFGKATVAFKFSGGAKSYQVISTEGKHGDTAFRRAIKPMLDAEVEAARDPVKTQSALSRQNYELSLLGQESCGSGRSCFRLRANPIGRRRDYLFAGDIWVDVNDFAVVRASGTPAKIPFGVSEAPFVRTYSKVGGFYFPAKVESEIKLYRIAGLFTSRDFRLNIQYGSYVVNP